MNTLDISAINTNAPYSVWNVGEYYFFRTKYGALYKIGFMPDDTIWDENAYQFLIVNENNTISPNDAHLKETVFCIIEGFCHSHVTPFEIRIRMKNLTMMLAGGIRGNRRETVLQCV